jgi:hypothetical protein
MYYIAGADSGFQVRGGGALKKIVPPSLDLPLYRYVIELSIFT